MEEKELTMCRAANTPSTMAQQKAATTPKLMNTMAATSWGRGQRSGWALRAPDTCPPNTNRAKLLCYPGSRPLPTPPCPDSAAPGGRRSCWAFHTADWGLLTPGASAVPVNKWIIKRSAVSCYCKLCDKDPACVLCTNLGFCVGISAGRALEPTRPTH